MLYTLTTCYELLMIQQVTLFGDGVVFLSFLELKERFFPHLPGKNGVLPLGVGVPASPLGSVCLFLLQEAAQPRLLTWELIKITIPRLWGCINTHWTRCQMRPSCAALSPALQGWWASLGFNSTSCFSYFLQTGKWKWEQVVSLLWVGDGEGIFTLWNLTSSADTEIVNILLYL